MSCRRIPAVGRSSMDINQELKLGFHQRLILAEGDSWFSIFLGGINLLRGTNLLNHIDTEKDSAIIDLSYPGDSLQDIVGTEQKDIFRKILYDQRFGFRFDLILLSAGGNDVIANLLRVIRTPQKRNYTMADCIRPDEIIKLLNESEAAVMELVKLRDSSRINKTCPILMHTYDYITPRNLATEFLIRLKGPWAYSAMRATGIKDPVVQKQITDHLLLEYSERLMGLAARVKNFHVAPTLGTLNPAKVEDLVARKDWADEIHPSPDGFEKLATRVVNPLINQLIAQARM